MQAKMILCNEDHKWCNTTTSRLFQEFFLFQKTTFVGGAVPHPLSGHFSMIVSQNSSSGILRRIIWIASCSCCQVSNHSPATVFSYSETIKSCKWQDLNCTVDVRSPQQIRLQGKILLGRVSSCSVVVQNPNIMQLFLFLPDGGIIR